MTIGSNGVEFEVIEGWEQLPEGWSFVEVAGVATDSEDRVYAFNRGEHPMIVFDRDGRFIDAWGEGIFSNAHGVSVGPDDRIYCADNGDHTVRVFEPDGTLIRTLGTPGKASETGFTAFSEPVTHSAGPFNMVTNSSVAPNGDLYVSDGYGNARVHVFSPDGDLQFSWGEPGTGPGQFRIPHGIVVDRNGRVYVADRENSRVQVFTESGELITIFEDLQRPDDVFIDADDRLYVAELGWKAGVMPQVMRGEIPPHEPHAQVSVLDLDGTLITRFGGDEPCAPGNFFAPHGIWADSVGDLYVAEVTASAGGRKGLVPMDCHALQKFTRIRG